MQHRSEGRGVLVRLDRGEELVASLTGLCRDYRIACARLDAIGAVERAELGYYDLAAHRYETRAVDEICELLSLQGNVALVEGEPFVHAHVVLGRRDLSTLGGHLLRATVAVTVEAFLDVWEEPVVREQDPEVRLKLLRL